jgi:hypothetical protein
LMFSVGDVPTIPSSLHDFLRCKVADTKTMRKLRVYASGHLPQLCSVARKMKV